MKELVDKITSYNLFNYLLPGILFSVFASNFTKYDFITDNIIIDAFIYYFIGLIISRFGSLVIEYILIRLGLIEFASYKKYLLESKKDKKIETLLEANNMYRTLMTTFILLLLLKIFEYVEINVSYIAGFRLYILIIGLIIIFLFAYKKQTKYINERINS